jgi:NADH-quinone oxidoreductase subunit J
MVAVDAITFWILATILVVSSVLVVGQRNPMYSVFLLVVSFAALSGLYIQLDASFAAMIQIIVYVGAIMVLFLFVVMLLNAPTEEPMSGPRLGRLFSAGPRRFGAVLSVVLAVELALAFARISSAPLPSGDRGAPVATVYDIGVRLFRDYAFAFEATSVLILVAMVGAIVLARKEAR